jgi:hypothetical protein
MIRSILSCLLFLLFASCGKEELIGPELIGTWSYTSVHLRSATIDTVVKLSGIMIFEKSVKTYNAGGTEYGQSISARVQFPSVAATKPLTFGKYDKEVFIGNSENVTNYNYKNTFDGVYGYKDLYDRIGYGYIKMTMPSKGKLNFILEDGAQFSSVPFSNFYIELTKN